MSGGQRASKTQQAVVFQGDHVGPYEQQRIRKLIAGRPRATRWLRAARQPRDCELAAELILVPGAP